MMSSSYFFAGFFMRKRDKIIRRGVGAMLLGAAMTMWAATARAQEEPMTTIDAPAVVTLEQAARAALAYHQPFQISQETVTQLVQRRRRVFSAMLPKITLRADALRRRNPIAGLRTEDDLGINVTLEQPLFAGGKSTSGLRSASAQLHAGEQAAHQAKESLLLSVAGAYYEVLKARKRSELFDAERTRLREHRRSAEVQLKVGQVTKTVLLRAEAELAGAEANLLRAQADEAVARNELALLTGLPVDVALDVPAAPAPPPMTPDTLIADAEQQRPELLRSRFNEQAARHNVGVARSGLFPTIDLELTYEDSSREPAVGFMSEVKDKYALVRLTFPLFEGGLQIAKIQEARSLWRAAALDAAFVKETVGTEVRSAARNVEALAGSVEHFTAQVRFAKENYELVTRQFAVGLAANIDLLDANTTLLSAEQELAAATFDRDLSVFELYRSIGRLSAYLLNE